MSNYNVEIGFRNKCCGAWMMHMERSVNDTHRAERLTETGEWYIWCTYIILHGELKLGCRAGDINVGFM